MKTRLLSLIIALALPMLTACTGGFINEPDNPNSGNTDIPEKTETAFNGTVASFVSKYNSASATELQKAFNNKTLIFTDSQAWSEDLGTILARINTFVSDDKVSETSGKYFKVQMPNLVGDIPANAFYGCFGLTQFYAPKMKGSINKDAFHGVEDKLKDLTLGAVSYADDASFRGMTTSSCNLTFTAAPTVPGQTLEPSNIAYKSRWPSSGRTWNKLVIK